MAATVTRPATVSAASSFPASGFGAEELAALVTLREALGRLEPGLLNEILAPLARRLEEILARRSRGCWYLDACCHDREGLRSFALERIAGARVLPDRALDRPEAELDAHFADAYGIFAGPATEIAVLRVAPHRARWVADEVWHPRQSGSFREDGSYELHVPYGRPDELILDIRRLGPDAEVLAPPALREEVARRLREASAVYDGRRGRARPVGEDQSGEG